MKIDLYTHILPRKYKDQLFKKAGPNFHQKNVDEATSALWDLDVRFRIMDAHDGLTQVLTIASPPLEDILGAEDVITLSRIANDEMAELVVKYPDRFAGAVACLPMNDREAALKEADRAIGELKLNGIQMYSPMKEKPLDDPDFMPFYEKMAHYDLPIWIHPARDVNFTDYKSETRSKYMIFQMFGWPYETTAAMTRLVFSGVLERWPHLKFITHHCGGMVPFFAERITGGHDYAAKHLNAKFQQALSKPPIEYFKMFYADTALYGATPALMCGHAFFGTDHLLFATDMPFDVEGGGRYTRDTINAIEKMEISPSEKEQIFEGNARKLLRL